MDEREEKAKEKSATSTEFDKIRREISRQRMDLIREGQTLSFKEFQKLHKEQRIRSKTQAKTNDENYDIPEKKLKTHCWHSCWRQKEWLPQSNQGCNIL